jgi:heme exporter protein D
MSDVFWVPLLGLHRGVHPVVRDHGPVADPDRDPVAAAEGASGAGKGGVMPDLGKYAGAVLGSYAATAVLIAVLVGLTLWQSARMKRALGRGRGAAGEV